VASRRLFFGPRASSIDTQDALMSDLTRVKGMAGRKRRTALNRHPAVVLRESSAPRADDEVGRRANVNTGADDAELELMGRVALRSTYSPLRAVVVVVAAGRVILIGRIPSFYLTQVAQEAARRVSGAAGFENRLVVERADAAATQPDDTSEPIHPDGTSGVLDRV
jgi:osmotically-inducible protein OsmY